MDIKLDTRHKLLEVAGEVFAERGFRDATIREICERAGVNVASINYHFRDKFQLYLETIGYVQKYAFERFQIENENKHAETSEERLHYFIKCMVLRMFDEGRPAWHCRLWMREMVEPTEALDRIVDNVIRPQFDELKSIIRSFAKESSEEDSVKLVARSVIGQCLFYHHSRAVLERLNPEFKFDQAYANKIIEHIYQFSHAGIKNTFNGT